MPRQAKSQWEFGELFPPEATRKIHSVSELTGNIRRTLEKDFNNLWVSGEITNLRLQTSGHVYFTLKDARSQISCVMFRSEAPGVNRNHLLDGQKVIVHGPLTVYEVRGQYQIQVQGLEFQGVGALQVAFEKLKAKLQAEGLFAAERKRSLPRFPSVLGIVTSSDGAAIRDVLHVIERRHPGLKIVLAACKVQGVGAANEIACAINLLNEWAIKGPSPGADLILVTRGGGSLEDLWAFNEEPVARAIFSSRLPVISAVGHEIDFTISDFVADFRAATPSAAAEILTEQWVQSRKFVVEAEAQLHLSMRKRIEFEQLHLLRSTHRLQRLHPKRWINDQRQQVDDFSHSLHRCARQHIRQKSSAWIELARRFRRVRPAEKIERRRLQLVQLEQRLQSALRVALDGKRNQLTKPLERLRLLSPQHILERGYSITTREDGKVIRNPGDVQAGETIITTVQGGKIDSVVSPRL